MLDEVDKKANAWIEPDHDRHVTHAWLNRTRWARHLGGLDREWLFELIQKPRRNEKALSKLCWAVQTVIWKAQQASRPSVVGFPAMNYVNRREMGSETNEKPFNARQTGKTMAKYAGWWSSIIRYIWRTHELEAVKAQETEAVEAQEAEADEKESGDGGSKGVRGRRPPYRLTASQIVWLWKIKQVAGEDEEEAEGGSQHQPIEGGDDGSETEEEIDEEEEELLEAHVLGFLVSLLDHYLKDNEYKSALVSATAVIGVDGDRRWKDPLAYTPIISAIVTVARMLVLYTAVKTR
jgi:hypothetical protein